MKRTFACLLAGVALAWAGMADGAEPPPAEDETLPRPLAGQSSDYYVALARVHTAFGHFGVAEKLQLKAIEVEPAAADKEALSHELVQRIYARAGWWDKAARELLRTMSLVDKEDAAQLRRYHLERAAALAQTGRADEQIEEIDAALALAETPEDTRRTLRRLHLVLFENDWLEDRVKQYEEHVRQHPDDNEMLRLLAEIYHGNGLFNLPGRAIEKYEQIRRTDPDDLDACEHLARLYAEAEQRDKSLAMYEHLMGLHPKRFETYFATAASQFKLPAEEVQVIEWARGILEAHPDQPAVARRIAALHRGRGEHAEAIPLYRKAIELTLPHAEKLQIHFTLIQAQIAARQYAEAEKTCREAEQLRVLSPSLRRRLRTLLNQARDLQGKPPEE